MSNSATPSIVVSDGKLPDAGTSYSAKRIYERGAENSCGNCGKEEPPLGNARRVQQTHAAGKLAPEKTGDGDKLANNRCARCWLRWPKPPGWARRWPSCGSSLQEPLNTGMRDCITG